MAKNKNATTVHAPVGTAPVGTPTVGTGTVGIGADHHPATRPSAPSTDLSPVAHGTRPTGVAIAEQVGGAVAGTADVVRTLLPNRLPAYLGGGALLVVGLIDPPAALAGGLVYEALRRWTPTLTHRTPSA